MNSLRPRGSHEDVVGLWNFVIADDPAHKDPRSVI